MRARDGASGETTLEGDPGAESPPGSGGPLGASRDGAPAGSRKAEAPPSWRTHDFRRPRRLSELELQALDTLHGKFAKGLSATLSVLVRTRMQVELASVMQGAYFEFLRSLPNPTCLHLAYGHPEGFPLVLEMNPGILFPMMERLLGGKGDGLRQPTRPLTRIEQRVSKVIAEKFLATLAETWSQGASPESAFRWDLAEVEHNPLLMQIVGPSEPTLILAFETTLGLRGGRFHVAVPLRPFETAISTLLRTVVPGLEDGRNSERERERILGRLSSSGVTLTAELATIHVGIQDLLTLRPGDTIDTQVPRRSELGILVEGHEVFRGVPAVREGRRSVKITRSTGDRGPKPA